MFELTYSSFASPDLNKKDIFEIERISTFYNAINDITGCLVYHNKEFVQILEGDELVVKALFAKITKDNRHRAISSVFIGSIAERQFKDWRMICNHLNFHELVVCDNSLFEKNLNSLSSLIKPKTRGSQIFWNCVAELTDI